MRSQDTIELSEKIFDLMREAITLYPQFEEIGAMLKPMQAELGGITSKESKVREQQKELEERDTKPARKEQLLKEINSATSEIEESLPRKQELEAEITSIRETHKGLLDKVEPMSQLMAYAGRLHAKSYTEGDIEDFVSLLPPEDIATLNQGGSVKDNSYRELAASIARAIVSFDELKSAKGNFKELDVTKYTDSKSDIMYMNNIGKFLTDNWKSLNYSSKANPQMIQTLLITKPFDPGATPDYIEKVTALTASIIAKVIGNSRGVSRWFSNSFLNDPGFDQSGVLPVPMTLGIADAAMELVKTGQYSDVTACMEAGKEIGKAARDELFKQKAPERKADFKGIIMTYARGRSGSITSEEGSSHSSGSSHAQRVLSHNEIKIEIGGI